MKSLLIIILLCILCYCNTSEHHNNSNSKIVQIPPHLQSLVQKCAKPCKVSSKVTKEDLEVINKKLIPDTRTGLSFLQCLMEKIGLIRRGKFMKQAVVTNFAFMTKECPERKKLLKRISEECGEEMKKIEKDCTQFGDLAKHVLQCFDKYKDQIDIVLPEIMLTVP